MSVFLQYFSRSYVMTHTCTTVRYEQFNS